MAVDFSGLDEVTQGYQVATQGGIRTLARALMSPDPEQPRRKFNAQALQELAESIREHGVIQPIVVRQLNDGTYMIVTGERRWRAAAIAGVDEVPVVVRDDLDAFAQVVENIQREDLAPADIWRWISAQVESGTPKNVLASKLGKSNGWVSAYCAVDKMPDSFKLALTQGLAADITALGQLFKLWKQHPGHADRLLQSGDPITRNSVAGLAEQLARVASKTAGQETSEASSLATKADSTDGDASTDKTPAPPEAERKSGVEGGTDATALPVRILVRYEGQSWAVIYTKKKKFGDGERVLLINEGGMELYASLNELVLISIR